MPDFTERNTHRVSLADVRENYTLGGLDEANCETNPIVQFERWLKNAQVAGLKEPNAMTLATATRDGKPSARVVLLKEVSDLGFVFYTNYSSRKGQDLATNPFAALTFYWAELERQVRVEGRIEVLSRAESESYFRVRPRGSQLGAWASNQSEVAFSRDEIEGRLKDVEARFSGVIPAPEYWGGYRVFPEAIEFWQGRPNRLHDRILYRKQTDGNWSLERLWP
ncbi:MAG: pyridoxamine 5'-phosphate oxidase [Acidobacteriota bacterium]|nr:pyridoxamine 5'-phosphate oxidase [Acidobacteriota bacterium]